MKNLTQVSLTRAITLVVLVGSMVLLSMLATSWSTSVQSTYAQTVPEPPVTPVRTPQGALVREPAAPTTQAQPGDTDTEDNLPDASDRPIAGVQPIVVATPARSSSGQKQPVSSQSADSQDNQTNQPATQAKKPARVLWIDIADNGIATAILTDGSTISLGHISTLSPRLLTWFGLIGSPNEDVETPQQAEAEHVSLYALRIQQRLASVITFWHRFIPAKTTASTL